MKSAIIALCLVAYAYAVSDKDAQVLRSDTSLTPEGNFDFSYETENGIHGQASGNVEVLGEEKARLEIKGAYSYTGSDGKVYSIEYVANENGFQPKGDHLPTPPAPEPIPEYIARSLEYIKAHPYVEKKQ